MASLNDYLKNVERREIVLTKFLDTTEQSEFRKYKNNNIKIAFFGGFNEAERVRAILYKNNIETPLNDEFEITVIKVELSSDKREVTHRHVLGTLMSLGIKRETIGDIIVNGLEIIIFTVNEMSNFLINNLYEINQISCEAKIISIEDINIEEKSEDKLINIASLRLDAVIAKIINASRNKAVEVINKGLVQVNHIECLNTSYFLKINDLLSIRHFGRVEIMEIVNTTKKDRLVVRINIKH